MDSRATAASGGLKVTFAFDLLQTSALLNIATPLHRDYPFSGFTLEGNYPPVGRRTGFILFDFVFICPLSDWVGAGSDYRGSGQPFTNRIVFAEHLTSAP